MRDPYVSRAAILNRIRPLRPHLGVDAGDEQALLNRRGQLQVLAALNGDNLQSPGVAVLRALPDDPAIVPHPPAVVHGYGDPRSHQVLEQQREAEADRPSARDRDLQGARGRLRGGTAGRRYPDGPRGGARIWAVEPEDLVADRDQVPVLERAHGDRCAVDPGSVGTATVVQDIAAGLRAELGVQARG